jgi:glycosyltransferase involved in cell wall biosynthesis
MTLILCMIVKDEAHVIRRCLESVKPYVDGWVIADTGSSDETCEIIREVMGDLPGYLVAREWVDFATNRNEVLNHAREWWRGSEHFYALTIDADEVLRLDHLTAIPSDLFDDGYYVDVHYGGMTYPRLAITRLGAAWEWVGVVHEYLAAPEGATTGHLPSVAIEVFHEGARSRDPDTYRKDAALLERELLSIGSDDPLVPRYMFYLAESYRNAGDTDAALETYYQRVEHGGGYRDEVWYSLLQIARLTGSRDAYLGAYAYDRTRPEPLVDLARIERLAERFPVAAMYAREAVGIKAASDALFVDTTCEWRALDELAVSSWYAGNRKEAVYAARRALDVAGNASSEDRVRLADNLRMMEEA